MISSILSRKAYVFLIVFTCSFLLLSSKTHAAVQGTGYFSGESVNIGTPANFSNDVIRTSNRVAIPASVYDGKGNDKADFMAWLDGYVSQGSVANTQNEVGGAFIVNTMLGKTGSARTKNVSQAMLDAVAARIAPNNIVIRSDVRDPNGIGTGKISFFNDSGTKDDFYSDDWNPGQRAVMLFIDTSQSPGKIVYALEIACANPVGQLKMPIPTPTDWENDAISSVPVSAYPGETVTFTHYVYNDGPASMDSSRGLTVNARWTRRVNDTSNTIIKNCNVGAPGLANNAKVYCNTTFTIPQTAQKGDLYCQGVWFSPVSNTNSQTDHSTSDCVRVANWSVSSTSSVSAGIAFINQPVIFSHTIKNNGPDKLNKPVDGDILWSGAFPECTTIVRPPPESTPPGCYQYRAKALDLVSGTASGYVSPVATRSYSFATPGTYCEYVRINPENGNDFVATFKEGSRACVFVIDPASAAKAPTGRYEKGQGGTVTMTHELLLNLNASTCPASAVTVSWSVSGYSGNGTAYNNTPVTSTIGAGNCTNPSYTVTVNGSWLDTQTIGNIAYKTMAGSTTANGALTVYTVPYARFYGNDIYASGCGTDANNGTIGFNTKNDSLVVNANNKSAGSAVEYAAFALKLLDGTTKLNHISSGAYSNYPLNGSSLRLSSNFVAGKLVCPSTVLSNVEASLPDNSNITLGAGDTYNVYSANGGTRGYLDAATKNVTLTASGVNNANSAKQTIYANDVYVSNPIDLSPTSPFDPNAAPVLLIVAKGNVYIDRSVQTVSAIIVAGGTVYTCADTAAKVGYNAPDLKNNCGSPLEIKGSVVANEIKFGRTYGTRLCATDYEASYPTCGTGVGRAAEVISFPAYMHFISPYLKDTAGSTFPAIFSPAPYF